MTPPPATTRRRRFNNTNRFPSRNISFGLAVAFVVAFSMVSLLPSTEESSFPMEYSISDDFPRIRYSVVDTNHGKTISIKGVVRYAAYESVSSQSPSFSQGQQGGVQSSAQNHSTWRPLSIQQWAELISSDAPWASRLQNEFVNILRNSSYEAFFFETKGASSSNASEKQFEFVLVDTPYLYSFAEGNPDPATFAEHLKCSPKELPGCIFTSLGGDATLVAPRRDNSHPHVPDKVYSHLAAFVRGAPQDQVTRYWKMVATAYLKVLQKRTVWLSTDGTGVAWLHMRLDSKPKYYSYSEFAMEP